MADRTNRIADVRKRAGLSQQDLAERVGSHWITISKLERGKMQLTAAWLERLSEALGADIMDFLPAGPAIPRRVVIVRGKINPDGSIISRDDGWDDSIAVPADGADDALSYWLTCEGDAFFPFCSSGDAIRFVSVDKDHADYGLGRICHVATEDGRQLVGILAEDPKGGFSITLPGQRPTREIAISTIGIAVEAKFAIEGLTVGIAN